MNIMIINHLKKPINKLLPLKRREKGVLLVELMVAVLIIVLGIMAMVSSFAIFATMSAKTRNRVYAEVLAKSMIDRIREHEFGEPEPYNWNSSETVSILPDIPMHEALGRGKGTKVSRITFKKEVEYKNGSFVGKTDGNYDVITITISWEEKNPARVDKKPGSKVKLVIEACKNIPDQEEED